MANEIKTHKINCLPQLHEGFDEHPRNHKDDFTQKYNIQLLHKPIIIGASKSTYNVMAEDDRTMFCLTVGKQKVSCFNLFELWVC